MPEGFDYDPEAIRAFAEVFDRASAQVGQVAAALGRTSAKAEDFGASRASHGADFETWMAALTEDLGRLSEHLGEVGGRLQRGTDLVVEADTAAARTLTSSGGAA